MDLETFANSTITNDTTAFVHHGGSIREASWITAITGLFLTPIIMLGTLGNIFSLVVWVKGRRRDTSTARFLSGLAIADIVVLSTSALEFWVSYVLHTDMTESSRFLCKFFSYMSFLGPAVSAWILVAVTVERALSVWIPHKITVACRPVTASIVIGCTVFGLCLVYLPVMLGKDIVTVVTSVRMWTECSVLSASSYNRYYTSWLMMDLCIFFIVPFALITICNISIMVKVVCLSRKATVGNTRGQSSAATGKAKKMLKTVTRRILILTLTFCICNAPLSVFNFLLITPSITHVINPRHVQSFRIPFHLLMYLNNGVNFLLYCVIGSGFRRDFLGLFGRGSRASNSR